jgi:hypothetical protein
MNTNSSSPLTASLRRYLAEVRPSAELDDLPAAEQSRIAFSGRFWHWAEEMDPDFYATWRAFPEDEAGAFIREVEESRPQEATG